ncbi:hypothetical protein AHAS_Ahas15G0336200 [Arachis hypogaea]
MGGHIEKAQSCWEYMDGKNLRNSNDVGTLFPKGKVFEYIRTMSQCKGINSLIRFYVNLINTLIDFMCNLDRALNEYKNNELVANFKSQCSEPTMITSLEVYERFTANCFTCNIFKKKCNEIQKVGTLNIKLLPLGTRLILV